MKKLFTKNISGQEFSLKLASELVEKYLKTGTRFTLFLEGGLGAGKTFMTQAILKELGVKTEVTSPTYSIVNEYESCEKEGSEHQRFAHFDFYRLEEPNDFFARGFQDIADDGETSCFVEWPEKISPESQTAFGGNIYVLKIEIGIEPDERIIDFFEVSSD